LQLVTASDRNRRRRTAATHTVGEMFKTGGLRPIKPSLTVSPLYSYVCVMYLSVSDVLNQRTKSHEEA